MWQGLNENETNLTNIFISVNFFLPFGIYTFLFSIPQVTLLKTTTITKKAEINFHSL